VDALELVNDLADLEVGGGTEVGERDGLGQRAGLRQEGDDGAGR
jgi:hypothetical protein